MNRKIWASWGALLVIVAIAIGFRFYDIQNYPPGLFPDEAANGEDTLLILEGDWRPFYPRGNGREGLFFFLQALSVRWFGVGVWPMHVVSGVVGILTVVAIYFATLPYFGRLAASLAALFLATSHWHVTLSRTGFRAILAPLFIAAFTAWVGFTVQAVRRGQKRAAYIYAALAGAAFMGGFYSYIAYRAMIGVVLGILVLMLLAAWHPKIGFPHVRRYGKQFGAAIIAAVIVIAPLAWHFIQHPSEFIGRAGQVSVFNKELQAEYGGGTLAGTLAYTTRETLKSFFAGQGDLNWRHNVAGYPLLNPLVGVLFLLGLAWAIHGTVQVFWNIKRGEEIHLGMIYPYLLLLLLGMLLPVITTAEGIPHGLRSLGLLPAIFVLAGAAGAVGLHWLDRRFSKEGVKIVSLGLALGLMGVMVFYDGSLYFLIARNDSGAAYAYRADLTDVSRYVLDYATAHAGEARPYLVLDGFSLQTVHWLTHRQEEGRWLPTPHDYVPGGGDHPDSGEHLYQEIDPASSHLTPLAESELIIFTQSTLPDADRYFSQHPAIELVESRHNRFGQEIMRIYRGTAAGEVQGIQDEGNTPDLDA